MDIWAVFEVELGPNVNEELSHCFFASPASLSGEEESSTAAHSGISQEDGAAQRSSQNSSCCTRGV